MRRTLPKAGGEAPDVAAVPIWQPAGAQCALCTARRRDYLFVVGSARVTRCHECGLISRTGPAGTSVPAYRLDRDSATSLLAGLPRGRILQVCDRSSALPSDDGRDFFTVDDSRLPEALKEAGPRAFDAALLNAT